METGLFEIQADHLSGIRQARQVHPTSREVVYALFGWADSVSCDRDPASHGITNGIEAVPSSVPKEPAVDPSADLARCFLRGMAPSVPWFAAIQGIKRNQILAGLAPKGCFISAVERGQIGEAYGQSYAYVFTTSPHPARRYSAEG